MKINKFVCTCAKATHTIERCAESMHEICLHDAYIESNTNMCTSTICVPMSRMYLGTWIYLLVHIYVSTGDKYNPNDAPNRQVKRAIEKENQKVCMHVNVHSENYSQKVCRICLHMRVYVRTYVSICFVILLKKIQRTMAKPKIKRWIQMYVSAHMCLHTYLCVCYDYT